MKKHSETLRAIKFVLFSTSAGIIQMGSFALLNELSGWSYWPCYLISLVLSVLWNFTLNRRFTFQSASNVPIAMAQTNGDGVNIRSEASTSGKVQGAYNKGDVVTILEIKGEWGRTNKGWIKMEYVNTNSTL